MKIATWNCCGLSSKSHQVDELFEISQADILILNETFRQPGTPWPSVLPPLLAEATSSGDSRTRQPAGVAVLANPLALRQGGKIRSCETIEVDNENGTKVVVKVNNLIIMAVYAPGSRGCDLLASFLQESSALASNGVPVVICGDLNAPHEYNGHDGTLRARHRTLISNLGPDFFRADTGPVPTRPSNRPDSLNPEGNFLDHILGANVNFLESNCLSDFVHTSDHHPICARVFPRIAASDTSIRYWRLLSEKFQEEETRSQYRTVVEAALPALETHVSGLISSASFESPIPERHRIVDEVSRQVSGHVLAWAKQVVGVKFVPVVPGRVRLEPSAAYVECRTALDQVFRSLSALAHRDVTHPRVAELLLRRDALKQRLQDLNSADQVDSYREWTRELSKKSASERMKILNRIMRRRSAAGASLSSTPPALESYRNHFRSQCMNDFNMPTYAPRTTPDLDLPDLLDFSDKTFDECVVQGYIIKSPKNKAPGLSGLTADILHPIADLIAPLIASMFRLFFKFSVVPSGWTKTLVCPVPKKGDLSRIGNYRPISLTEVLRKIYEMCLLGEMQTMVPLSREQGGFRIGRSTIDQIESLDRIIKAQPNPVHLAFLDIKAAYDSVPRAELWRRCETIGLPDFLIRTLRALFDHNSSQLAIKQKRCSPYGLSAGVLQGSVLSPILYSIYLDLLVFKLRIFGPAVRLGDSTSLNFINSLLYADDIVLISKTRGGLQQLLNIAERDSISRGYRFSPAKCVVLSPLKRALKLYGAPLTHQRAFSYLGMEFTYRGVSLKSHFKKRIAKAEKAANLLRQAGARFRNFPARINVQLYAAFIRPGLEYGLPLAWDEPSAISFLEKCQKRLLCGFLGVNVIARNDVVHSVTGCLPLVVRCEILTHRRLHKLASFWSSADADDRALCFVSKSLRGPDLPVPSSIDLSLTRAEIIERRFLVPINSRLATLFGGNFSFAILRRLLRNDSGPGVIRTVLLWILGRWNSFRPRLCCKCGESFTQQSHIDECCDLPSRLASILPLFDQDPVTPSTSLVVIGSVLSEPLNAQRALLPALEALLRLCISEVFGAPVVTI